MVKCRGLDQPLFLLPHPQQPLASSPTGTSQNTKFSNSCYQCCVSCQCKLWYSHLHFVPYCRIIILLIDFLPSNFSDYDTPTGTKELSNSSQCSDSKQHCIPLRKPYLHSALNWQTLKANTQPHVVCPDDREMGKTWVTHYTSSIAENVEFCFVQWHKTNRI